MRLYHFTSMENWKSIENGRCILKKNTVHNGKNVLMLTTQESKHCQLWAVGEHRSKTEVRLTVDTVSWKELELPEAPEEIHRLVSLGAVRVGAIDADVAGMDIYGLTGKSVDTSMYSNGEMNWIYCYGTATINNVKIWNEKSRRYAPIKLSPEDEIIYLQEKISDYYKTSNPYLNEKYFTDWYKIRWINHYEDRIKELEDLVYYNKGM